MKMSMNRMCNFIDPLAVGPRTFLWEIQEIRLVKNRDMYRQ